MLSNPFGQQAEESQRVFLMGRGGRSRANRCRDSGKVNAELVGSKWKIGNGNSGPNLRAGAERMT